MKKRSTPHVPAVSSRAYDCGGTKFTLLPNSVRESDRLAKRLNALYPEGSETPAGFVHGSLMVGMAWDDTEYELDTKVPEDVLGLDDDDLKSLGEALLDEFDGKASRRLCRLITLLKAGSATVAVDDAPGN